MSLRCSVAANPVAHNSILQIDWLRNGQKLDASAKKSTAMLDNKLTIEKSSQLHLPTTQGGSISSDSNLQQLDKLRWANQLVASSKLMAASKLTISQVSGIHSGTYSCQFRLIPTPTQLTGQSSSDEQLLTAGRISSGRANESIQVNVIEGKRTKVSPKSVAQAMNICKAPNCSISTRANSALSSPPVAIYRL